ncbi:hypothetical protein VTN00DRAFT_5952 [Thermoascus crustaceus]
MPYKPADSAVQKF